MISLVGTSAAEVGGCPKRAVSFSIKGEKQRRKGKNGENANREKKGAVIEPQL